ncbi:hypothetical protein T484DRAFT_1647690 [Baffinella frigidus]|nr:hypothetical protein T484DRAFT_1647690 [Cryptophyta sp. CCMP2293]
MEHETRDPKPETRNPKPETRNPKPETRNPKHETRNPNPETQGASRHHHEFAKTAPQPSSVPSIWAHQFVEPGLIFARKLTDLYRKPSMSTCE